MRLPLVAGLAELTRTAIGQVVETVAAAATVPYRAMSVLGQAELLVSRITVIADQAEALVQRVAVVAGEAEEALAATNALVRRVAVVADEAEEAAAATGTLVRHVTATADSANEAIVEVESLIGRAARVSEAAGLVVGRVARITDAAEGVVTQATDISANASAVVGQAESATADAAEILHAYAATLRKGAPIAARFVDELSPEEVTAAIRMVDALPQLRDHLVGDVLPLLSKLDQVGPDLHKLLEVTEDLRLAIAGIPGLRMLKRRGEEATSTS
jgi:hypothetical protein